MARPRVFRASVPLLAPPEHHRTAILTFRHDQAACLVRVSIHVVTTSPHKDPGSQALSIDTRTLALDIAVEAMKIRNNKLMMLMAQHHKDDINARTGPGWWLMKRYVLGADYDILPDARAV